MGKDVVEDCLKSIFLAIRDLIKYDRHIQLQFGFANVNFINRNLKVQFAEFLSKTIADKEFETTMRRSNSPVGQTWRTNTQSDFHKSALGTMIRKPDADVNQALMQKTQALKLMSLDMSSSAKAAKK